MSVRGIKRLTIATETWIMQKNLIPRTVLRSFHKDGIVS